jgi:DNA-directed RNA polymerase subunit RPC12/RpoP
MVRGAPDPAKAGLHLLEKKESLQEYRCQRCGRMLFVAARLKGGPLVIRCPRKGKPPKGCGYLNHFYLEKSPPILKNK